MRMLFLCVANSARSQMAEGWARALSNDDVETFSAGSEPSCVRPEAIAVLREVGIDLRGHSSKGVTDVPEPDLVATLCAEEVCPVYPGAVRRLSLATEDPAGHDEPWEARLARFRRARDWIGSQVADLLEAEGLRQEFGAAVRNRFALRPDMVFLNHGSFGAAPRSVVAARRSFEDELEAQPVAFMRALRERLERVRHRLAAWVGSAPGDLVLVDNATSGVNAVVRSLDLSPGDRILTTNHAYGAVRKTLDYAADRAGAEVLTARVPFPIGGAGEVVAALERAWQDGVRLVVVDHISSITGLVFPVELLVALAHERGAAILVDGAHVPGHLPLDLDALGADFYVGNAHKWLFAPKGCALLHARPERQAGLAPTVISHGWGEGFAAAFDWLGTRDPSPWLAIEAGLDFLEEQGADRVRAHNILLRRQAADWLCDRLSLARPAPDEMLAALSTLPLPGDHPATQEEADRVNQELWNEHRVEACIAPFAGCLWFRIGPQIYNTMSDYEALADAIETL